MRNLREYLDEYGQSHRNPTNQLIHFICVPAIFFSTLGLLWLVPVGQWLGVEAETARWVNGATLLGVVSSLFYIKMSMASLGMMVLWFAASVAGILGLEAAGLSVLWTCVTIWVVAWIIQLYGHKIEGAKPSFFKEVEFLLVGPLFVVDELRHLNSHKVH